MGRPLLAIEMKRLEEGRTDQPARREAYGIQLDLGKLSLPQRREMFRFAKDDIYELMSRLGIPDE